MNGTEIRLEHPLDLEPGDILFWRGSGWIARTIRHCDRSPWSHVGLHYATETRIAAGHPTWTVEATERGVVWQEWDWTLTEPEGRGKVVVVRPDLPQEVRARSVQMVLRHYLGRGYAFNTLLGLALVLQLDRFEAPLWLRLMGPLIRRATRAGGKSALICSEVVARGYRDTGHDLVPGDPDLVTPGDLWRGLIGG